MQKFFKFLIVPLSIYVIQFFVFPLIFNYNYENLSLFVVPILITVIALLKITDKFRYCLVTLPLYPLLIFIYHPPLLFGIGTANLVGPTLPIYDKNDAWLGVLICTCLLLVVEFSTWIIVKIILIIKKRKKEYK